MTTLLAWWETIKKDKHVNHCHDGQNLFSPFVFSVGGMIGRETLVVLANLSRIMAAKMDEPISNVRGWVNGQIAILIARLYS